MAFYFLFLFFFKKKKKYKFCSPRMNSLNNFPQGQVIFMKGIFFMYIPYKER